jgi:hypothetical protein
LVAIRGVRGAKPLSEIVPLSLIKGKGIQGIGLLIIGNELPISKP